MSESNSAFPAWLAVVLSLAVGFSLGIGVAMIIEPADGKLQTVESEKEALLIDKVELSKNLDHSKSEHAKLQEWVKEKVVELTALRDNRAADQAKTKELFETLRSERDALAKRAEQAQRENDRLQQLIDSGEVAEDFSRPTKPASRDRSALGNVLTTRGFTFFDVKFVQDGEIIGRVTNDSSADCEIVSFTLNLFDSNGSLLEVCTLVVSDIMQTETRSFSTYSDHGLPPGGHFEIDLETAYE